MTAEAQKAFFTLLRSAVSGDGLTDEEKVSFSVQMLPEMFDFADMQDIAHIIGYVLIKNGLIEKGTEIYDKFYAAQFVAICRYEKLHLAFVKAAEQLEKAKIDYLPLKGAVMCGYYPLPWMRTSCDVDVLVRSEDFERAIAVLQNDGWKIFAQTAHDVSLQLGDGEHIELHYSLFERKRLLKAYEVLNDVWLHSEAIGGSHEFVMSDEFFYFYHVAHMAKHFTNGGCGIRPFIDLWILSRRGGFNEGKCKKLLEDGGIGTFEEYAKDLCSIWFDGGEYSQITHNMERFLFDGGLYGTLSNSIGVKSAGKNGGIKYVLSRIWLPYDILKTKYTSLDGKRVLTLFYQIWRWIDGIINSRARVRLELENSVVTSAEKREMISMLEELDVL